MPKPKIRLVLVIWEDIQSRCDWIGELSEMPKEITPIRCVTVGWVVREDKQMLVVADSYTQDGTYGGATAIPSSVVHEILELDPRPPREFVKKKRKRKKRGKPRKELDSNKRDRKQRG